LEENHQNLVLNNKQQQNLTVFVLVEDVLFTQTGKQVNG
jgi:hypothetical protein